MQREESARFFSVILLYSSRSRDRDAGSSSNESDSGFGFMFVLNLGTALTVANTAEHTHMEKIEDILSIMSYNSTLCKM